jgi:holliday junction DNA helicase RuvB
MDNGTSVSEVFANLLQGDIQPTDDVQIEETMRPNVFEKFLGQQQTVQNLRMMVESAKKRQAALDHVLLSGPPGLGKTSLAMITARAMDKNFHLLSAPSLDKKADLAAILTNLSAGDVLFIDEIHRLPIQIEEILYSAMEDFRLDIVLGQGPSARTMQIDLSPFCLIGATTKSGLLSRPLRDRFIGQFHFDFYDRESLMHIISDNAQKMKIQLEREAVQILAECARGTPRIANRLLRRVRDLSIVESMTSVTERDVYKILKIMDIDHKGLTRLDRKILLLLNENYSGRAVGIEAICATLSEERSTIEDVHEPFLLSQGLILRTARGRMISEKGKEHLLQSVELSF